MRAPVRIGQSSPFRFNITPMIDVVFLLIIFFLVASYFVRSEHSRPVLLPGAQGGRTQPENHSHRLTVTVESGGELSVAGTSVSFAELATRIRDLRRSADADSEPAGSRPSPEIRIRSDRHARFSDVRKIIEECATSGIRSIRFAVTPMSAESSVPPLMPQQTGESVP